MAASATRLPIAPRRARPLATIVEEKGTFLASALRSQSPSRATSAARRVTFLAIAQASHRAEVEDRALNATSAARSDTLRGLARRLLAVEEEGTRASAAEEEAPRPATLAAESDICLVIASKAPSATTAVELATSPGTAHNLNVEPATIVVLKATSRVTAPTRRLPS